MELNKDQLVLFEDGHTEGYLEARYSNKYQAFYYDKEIEIDGYPERIRLYSTTVIDKPRRKTAKQASVKMVEIDVDHETAKAYAVVTGSNNKITDNRLYYQYIAKSICKIADGKVYAPVWAIM